MLARRGLPCRTGPRGLKFLSSVATIPRSVDEVGCDEFRTSAFGAGRPLVMQGGDANPASGVFSLIPKWFKTAGGGSYEATSHLGQFSDTLFPYELLLGRADAKEGSPDAPLQSFASWLSKRGPVYASLAETLRHHLDVSREESDGRSGTRLLQFYMPLALLLAALEFNSSSAGRLQRLYIAQAPLADLPAGLGRDVSVPDVVAEAGRGDVYGSSLWLGLEPTYTPWHRDPNPNLFCQLYGAKAVRLLPPAEGERVFRDVQRRLGRSGSARIRGEEMMQGPEREALHDAVWGRDAAETTKEARVAAGDSLFIPQGWWHSVRSESADGGLNGSINWWFR